MISIKVQCACGQRYAFDVEPLNGRMPSRVACPVCGADGTDAANELIERALTAQSSPPTAIRLSMQPSTEASSPPPAPPRLPPRTPAPGRPSAPQRAARQPRGRGKDGWATEETSLNKLGTYVAVGPGALGALVLAGFMGFDVPAMILCIVVGGCGLVGGVLNILGRGPILAGALIGLVISLGGFATAYGWVKGRESVYAIEATIAFVVGAIPGFVLQVLIQKVLKKRSGAAA